MLTSDLQSFQIQFECESAVWFNSKETGRFENFLIESAVCSFAGHKLSQTTQTINDI